MPAELDWLSRRLLPVRLQVRTLLLARKLLGVPLNGRRAVLKTVERESAGVRFLYSQLTGIGVVGNVTAFQADVACSNQVSRSLLD